MSDNVGERFETDVWMDMCTELLPPVGYPIAVKYISYHISYHILRVGKWRVDLDRGKSSSKISI